MTGTLGENAIVVGAGMGGLAAAAAIAPHFEHVILLERDSLPADFSARPGAGQSAHIHQLLKGGETALDCLVPGFSAALGRIGAPNLRVGLDIELTDFGGPLPLHDAGFSVTSMTRPAYEKILRDLVVTRPGVSIRDSVAVSRHVVEGGRVIGVELDGGERVSADLVIDTTGMNAPLIESLAADGHAAYETESVKINVAYTTGRFTRPAAFRGETRAFFVLPAPPDHHFGLLLPVENDEWVVTLGGRGANLPPRDLAGYLAYAEQCVTPEIHARLREATLIGELRTYRKAFATRRRFDRATMWPERLIAMGDGMSSVNPTYGQGMSVAALQAESLRAALDARAASGSGLDGLPAEWLPVALDLSQRAWSLAINSDYVYPETEGERPANFAMSRAMATVLRKLCDTDPDFLVFRYRLAHMLESGEALRSGPLAMRFFAALQGSMAPNSA